jgi:sulfur-oxidizing protein SoxX
MPLTSVPGDPSAGQAVFTERNQGHCVLCHQVQSLDAPFQGNIGPDLSGVGARLSQAQIRYRIIDASRLNPATTMPAYYRVSGLRQVAAEYEGKTVLSASQIEHLVAYLGSLR